MNHSFLVEDLDRDMPGRAAICVCMPKYVISDDIDRLPE